MGPCRARIPICWGDEETRHAILIDPVMAAMDRDLTEVHRLGLNLAYTVDTHIHADHITAALEMKRAVGSKIAALAHDRLTWPIIVAK